MRVRCACGARAVRVRCRAAGVSLSLALTPTCSSSAMPSSWTSSFIVLHEVWPGGRAWLGPGLGLGSGSGSGIRGRGGWSGRAGARHLELRSDLALDLLLHRAQPVLRDARRDATRRVEANRLACGRESGVSSSWGRPERGCAVPPEAPRGSRLRPGKRRRALSPRGSRAGRWGALWRRSKPAGLPSARISGRRKASHASGFSKSYVSSAGSIWLMVPFWSAGS